MSNLKIFKVNLQLLMNYNNEQLQTFLIEAELINQKVKALAQNKMSTEEFDKFTEKRIAAKLDKQQAQRRKQQDFLQMKKRGRDGKGITKDFMNFCRACHKEYELQTPTCLKCKRTTMTLQQRQKQLQRMVEDYKFTKKDREQKRQKWEMFQKTQAAVWKKSSIDYNKKWGYFVEDSQEEVQKEPILPKNDPNFRALQMDIQERKKKRAKDTQKAKNLKQKGNAQMKKENYQKAMQYYTLALEHIKDLKSVYTNRALAFIKLKRFKKAIKDCTNVIQYMEIFQKVGENKDLTFKAFSRRALAKKQIKQYKQALEDISHALKLYPNDKNGTLLKTQIEGLIKHSQTVEKLIKQNKNKENQASNAQIQPEQQDEQQQQIKSKRLQRQIIKQIAQNQLKQDEKKQAVKEKQKINEKTKSEQVIQHPIKQIPKRIANLSEANVQYLFNLILKQPETKSIFISAKGLQTLLNKLFQQQSSKKYGLLACICMDGSGVAEKKIYQWGIFKFYDIILQKFEDETKLNQSLYDFIDCLFEIMVPVTLYEPCRLQLSKSQRTYNFINTIFPSLLSKYKKQSDLLDNFLIFTSNLCSGDSYLKNNLLKPEQFVIMAQALLVRIFDQDKGKNRKILNVKQTAYSLIANVVTNIEHRKAFAKYVIDNSDRLDFFKNQLQNYPRFSHNFDGYMENLLSVFANLTLDTQFKADDIADSIFSRFVANWENYTPTIVHRSLLTLSRLRFDSNQNLTKWMTVFDKMSLKWNALQDKQQKNMAQIVKILNVLFLIKTSEYSGVIPANLFKALTQFLKSNESHEILFCNTCNLFGIILQLKGDIKEQVLVTLREAIEKLVNIAKQKTGNWRKSAAIMIAKSSGDPKCRSEIDRTHGMHVLQSIASFVTDKK